MLSTGCSRPARFAGSPSRARREFRWQATSGLSGLSGLSTALRIPTFTVLATTLTFGGHVVAQGCSPSVAAVTFVAAAAATGRAALGRRTPGLGPLVGVITACQLLGHLVFSALATDPGVGGHHHGGTSARSALAGGLEEIDLSPAMLAAHLLVSLLCAWWLRQGELRSAELARRLAHGMPGPIALPPLTAASPVVVQTWVLTSGRAFALAAGRAPPAN